MSITKHLRITVNGKTYEVVAKLLDDEDGGRTAPAPPVAGAAARMPPATAPVAVPHGAAAAPQDGELRSPLAGKVVAVDAAPGRSVALGQTVITLEAMKMNTLIAAPCSGTVAEVLVKPGDAVAEGQLLMRVA